MLEYREIGSDKCTSVCAEGHDASSLCTELQQLLFTAKLGCYWKVLGM
jgi:hypothetical protein